jgi:signal transduction histidine kinase
LNKREIIKFFVFFVCFILSQKIFADQDFQDSSINKINADSIRVLNFINSSKKYSKEDFTQSLLYINLAFNEAKRIQKPFLRAFLFQKIGKIFNEYGYNSKAILSYTDALEIYKDSTKSIEKYKLYDVLGDVYFDLKEYSKAEKAYKDALFIVNKINNKKGIAITVSNLGNLSRVNGKLEEAWAYFQSIEKMCIEEEMFSVLSTNYLQMAMVCKEQEKDKLVANYLSKSFEIANENNFDEIIPEIANEFGKFYVEIKDYRKALNFYNLAYNLSRKNNQVNDIKIASNGLSQCYSFLNEYKQSLLYSEIFYRLNDSLQNVDKIIQVAFAEEKYKNEQTDKNIQNLTHEKEMAILKGKQNLRVTWLLLGLLFLSTLLSGFIYTRNIFRRKINKELEEKIKERTKELQNINKYLENVTYITTHDLKAPIVNLEGLIKLLKINQPMDEKAQKIIEHTEGTLNGMKKTVTDLSMMVANSKQEPAKDITLLFDEVLTKVSDTIQTQILSSKANIISDFEKYPSMIYPEKFLHSILLNLISNSIKYKSSDKTPIINIHTKNENDYCLLTYSDNGLGMDIEKYRNKIFSLYNRYHRHAEGQGIGLYLIKSQVEQMGGKIEILSKPDEGTTFYIYLKEQV